MTQEEKAKAYDEALERSKKLQETCDSRTVVGWVEYIFPELREDNDEKIRKDIKQHFLYLDDSFPDKAKWLNWLEKQGEQKPANKVMPKFHEGDWVIDKRGIVHQIANVIENVTNHIYGYDIVGGGYFNDNTEGVRLWTIQDAEEGDVLADGNLPFIFKKIDTNKYSYAYCGISVDGGFKIESDGESGEWTRMQDIKPATKEQCEQLEKEITDAGFTFDFEKKELKKIEHNPTWSEEDEYTLGETIQHLEELIRIEKVKHCGIDVQYYQRDIDWLKSLKERVQPQSKQE